MSYSLNIGGKRIRPILLLLTYKMYNSDYKKVLPIACSLEMIHTYSLIHDDLPCMDNDDLRRGKPTNHKVYGEAIAVLSGDGLLNEAVNIMFKYCLEHGKKELEACSLIANAAGADGMIGGQVVDILSEGKEVQEDELLYMHSKKTGELIKASIVSGAILAAAPEEEIRQLSEFGQILGLAFQIKDDILNVTGNQEIVGKSIHSDEENNKKNFITTYGLGKCIELSNRLTKECIEILKSLPRETSDLVGITEFLLSRDF
jgi:geranylgeranyl diphosphate synthase type II